MSESPPTQPTHPQDITTEQWQAIFQDIKKKGEEKGDPEGQLVMVYPPRTLQKMNIGDVSFFDGATAIAPFSGKETRRVYQAMDKKGEGCQETKKT